MSSPRVIPAAFPLFRLLLTVLILALLAGCTPQIDKSAWVVRSDIASPQGVNNICQEAKEAGLDSLLVQVRGRGDAYYRSGLAPKAECLADQQPDFDPLAATIAACEPLPVTAWLNVYYLWGGKKPPVAPSHPAQPKFGWILQDNDGRSVADYSMLDRAQGWIEGIYADPASAAYRKLFTRIVAEVAAHYPVAGIHLDFIRYPGAPYGFGPLGKQFAARWGVDPRWLPTAVDRSQLESWLSGDLPLPERVLTTGGLLWAETRAAQVTALVRDVRETILKSGRPIALSAAVMPDPGSAYLGKGQDWRTWEAEGLVDALYPMSYFGGSERVRGQLADIYKVKARRVRLWAGLGAFIKKPGEIAKEAAAARHLDFDGICLFDLGSLMKKTGGCKPYVEAATGRRPLFLPPASSGLIPATAAPFAGASESEHLKAIAAKAFGGTLPALPNLDRLFAARWREFTETRPLLRKIIVQMAAEPLRAPVWVDLQGVFRYLNPLDRAEKRNEQLATCLKARKRLLAGEKFASVAADLSQGGSKRWGGVLKRRWLASDLTDQFLASLTTGEISPVIKVANGFWCYQLLAKGKPEIMPLADLSWPARRILFRARLAHALDQ
jgi:uncharacterized lipoprotein YddW (UPF0748 family)